MPKREIGSTGIKNEILLYCQSRGGWWKARPYSPYGESGFPDIIGCFYERFIAFEAKHPKYKDPASGLRRDQALTLEAITCAGGIALPVNTIDQVRAILNVVENAALKSR